MRRLLTPCILAGLILWSAGQTMQLRDIQSNAQAIAADIRAVRQEQAALTEQVKVRKIMKPEPPPEPMAEVTFLPNPDMPLSPELQEYTVTTCEAMGLDPDILFRLMWRESGFQEDAWCIDTNGLESTGLCQINAVAYPFLEEHGIDPTESPEANIIAACTIIAYYRDEMGFTLEDALAAYGAGTGGMYTETAQEQAKELLEAANPWKETK